jgi:hypothetical protein
MDERTLRALIDAGAVKRVRIVARGARFHVEFDTPTSTIAAATRRGTVRAWASLDAAARWTKNLGIGQAIVELAHWTPGQRRLPLEACDGT